MNFRRFLSGIFYSIGDAFDSAKVSPRRGTPPGAYPTDAKNELPSYTRNELVRRARYLEKNSGHIRGTLRDMKVSVSETAYAPTPRARIPNGTERRRSISGTGRSDATLRTGFRSGRFRGWCPAQSTWTGRFS